MLDFELPRAIVVIEIVPDRRWGGSNTVALHLQFDVDYAKTRRVQEESVVSLHLFKCGPTICAFVTSTVFVFKYSGVFPCTCYVEVFR